MHREDNSKFLLYIEPDATDKLKEPIEDDMTKLIDFALSKAKSGVANYSSKDQPESFSEGSAFKGVHRTSCGEISSNNDYLLENGMIVNSLAPFYVRWYRDSIPTSDLNKIEQLKDFYNMLDFIRKTNEWYILF